MKKLVLISTFVLSSSLMAAPKIPLSEQISKIETKEISFDEYAALNGPGVDINGNPVRFNPNPNPNNFPGLDGGFTGGVPGTPVPGNNGGGLETAGKVIQTARNIVALGEAVYELVKKGKPVINTDYAPISVVPRDPVTKEYADPFDLEGFSMPVVKNYTTKIVSGTGKQVVVFTYRVMYSYGGSYDGVGKYLTGVNIIPGSVKATHGWDFNASMKLSGIMNHGSKANPIAGVMLTIKYQMSSWSTSFERNDTVHITGNGKLQSLSN